MLFLILSISLLFAHAIAQQISCENIQPMTSYVGEHQSCSLKDYTAINAPNCTLSAQRNELVEGLNFDGNKKISYLPLNVYKNFPNLLVLSADSCFIIVIVKDNFKNLQKLEELWLYGNLIERIESNTFEDLKNLEWLNLDDNNIKFLNGQTFQPLTKLKKVWLERNDCIDIDFDDKEKLNAIVQTVSTKCGFIETTSKIDIGNVQCGQVDSNIAQRIVDGFDKTLRGQYPFVTTIHDLKTNKLICGGTLVSSRHVLTAAHCVKYSDQNNRITQDDIYVQFGRYNLAFKFELGAIKRTISKVHIHPDWDDASRNIFEANIAILTMTEPVQFSSYIQAACLPTDEKINRYQEGVVVGFGKYSLQSPHVNVPLQANIQLANDSSCILSYSGATNVASSRTFCASGKEPGPCHGDTGGGIFIKIGATWTVKGVFSSPALKSFDCDIGSYQVFSNVVDFTQWIKSIVEAS